MNPLSMYGPGMFGNLGQFNYGGLGDSPALASPTSQSFLNLQYPYDQQHNPLENFLSYITQFTQPSGMYPGEMQYPEFAAGGIRG